MHFADSPATGTIQEATAPLLCPCSTAWLNTAVQRGLLVGSKHPAPFLIHSFELCLTAHSSQLTQAGQAGLILEEVVLLLEITTTACTITGTQSTSSPLAEVPEDSYEASMEAEGTGCGFPVSPVLASSLGMHGSPPCWPLRRASSLEKAFTSGWADQCILRLLRTHLKGFCLGCHGTECLTCCQFVCL